MLIGFPFYHFSLSLQSIFIRAYSCDSKMIADNTAGIAQSCRHYSGNQSQQVPYKQAIRSQAQTCRWLGLVDFYISITQALYRIIFIKRPWALQCSKGDVTWNLL